MCTLVCKEILTRSEEGGSVSLGWVTVEWMSCVARIEHLDCLYCPQEWYVIGVPDSPVWECTVRVGALVFARSS